MNKTPQPNLNDRFTDGLQSDLDFEEGKLIYQNLSALALAGVLIALALTGEWTSLGIIGVALLTITEVLYLTDTTDNTEMHIISRTLWEKARAFAYAYLFVSMCLIPLLILIALVALVLLSTTATYIIIGSVVFVLLNALKHTLPDRRAQ